MKPHPQARTWLLAAAGYAAAAAAMWHGFAPFAGFGDRIQPGDATEFAYFLAWGQSVWLSGDWARMFEVPLSHPLPHAGGLTDILPGLSLQMLPLRLFTDNPIAIFNATRLLCATLNGLAFFALALELGALSAAAFAGGFLYAFSGFMAYHGEGHLSALAAWWVPLAFLFTVRLLRTRRARWAVATGLALFLQGFTSSRLGFLGCFGVVVLVLGHGVRPWRDRPRWLPAAVLAACGAALVLMAAVYEPARKMGGIIPAVRGVKDATFCSLDLLGLLVPNPGSVQLRTIGRPLHLPYTVENTAFFGWIVYAGALVFALRRWRRRKDPRTPAVPWRPWLVLGLVAFVFALGPHLWVNGRLTMAPLPWRGVVHLAPALGAFRTVGRFVFLAGLVLSVLFTLGLSDWMRGLRRPGTAAAVAAAIVAVLAFEFHPGAGRRLASARPDAEEAQALREVGPGEAVAFLPFDADNARLLGLVPAFPPVVNSIRGGIRNTMADYTMRQLVGFPDEASLRHLAGVGVSTLVVRDDALRERLRDHPALEPVSPTVFRLRDAVPFAHRFSLLEKFPPEAVSGIVFDRPADFSSSDPPAVRRLDIVPGEADWSVNEMTDPRIKHGLLRARSTGLYPYLGLHLHPAVPAREVGSVAIRIRYVKTEDPTVRARFFWCAPGGWFDEDRSETVLVRASPDWQVVRFPVGDHPAWRELEEVNTFRLDPELPGFPGSVFEISGVRFESHSPAAAGP